MCVSYLDNIFSDKQNFQILIYSDYHLNSIFINYCCVCLFCVLICYYVYYYEHSMYCKCVCICYVILYW